MSSISIAQLPNLFAPRRFYALIALASLLMLLYALYTQYFQGLEPCPLCMLQRIAMIGLMLVCAIAALHNPGRKGWIVYGILAVAVAGTGTGLSARHVWLQLQPPDLMGMCAPPLDVMVQGIQFGSLKVGEVLARILTAKGDCAEVDWVMLGISMPGWVLIWCSFCVITLAYSAFVAARRLR